MKSGTRITSDNFKSLLGSDVFLTTKFGHVWCIDREGCVFSLEDSGVWRHIEAWSVPKKQKRALESFLSYWTQDFLLETVA